MAPHCCGPGTFQASDASADDDHVQWGIDWNDRVFSFPAGNRISKASHDGLIEHSIETALIAADALANLADSSFSRFHGEFGIRNESTTNTDCICIILLQNTFRDEGIVDPVTRENGDVNRFLDFPREIGKGTLWYVHRDHRDFSLVPATSNVDGIKSRRCEMRGNFDFILESITALDEITSRVAHEDGHVITNRVLDCLYDLDRESHPVLERATILVRAIIEEWR